MSPHLGFMKSEHWRMNCVCYLPLRAYGAVSTECTLTWKRSPQSWTSVLKPTCYTCSSLPSPWPCRPPNATQSCCSPVFWTWCLGKVELKQYYILHIQSYIQYYVLFFTSFPYVILSFLSFYPWLVLHFIQQFILPYFLPFCLWLSTDMSIYILFIFIKH